MCLTRWFGCMQIMACLFGAFAWGALPAPAKASGLVFNIVDYGVHNDGSASATEAFRAAIQAAKTAGGGTVYSLDAAAGRLHCGKAHHCARSQYHCRRPVQAS
jgi:hypothetical protein